MILFALIDFASHSFYRAAGVGGGDLDMSESAVSEISYLLLKIRNYLYYTVQVVSDLHVAGMPSCGTSSGYIPMALKDWVFC